MITFICQIDVITWLVDINGKTKMVFEFESDLALSFHIKEIRLYDKS